jgi:hypothetical protein
MTNFTAKLGTNRQKRRVWIEGKRLASHSWKAKETRYSVAYSVSGNTPVVTLSKDANGPKRVSGKLDKPIIDLCNDQIGPHMNNCERVAVTITETTISMTPEA